jgi:hypothetical protein
VGVAQKQPPFGASAWRIFKGRLQPYKTVSRDEGMKIDDRDEQPANALFPTEDSLEPDSNVTVNIDRQ